MRLLNIIFITLFSIGLMNHSLAQPCKKYHKKNCGAAKSENWKVNSQSKSGMISKGMTSELNFVIYKGQDYKISVCTEAFLGSEIEFKIKDTKSNIILYDNSKYKFSPFFEFSCASSRRLTIIVKIPFDASKDKEKDKDKGACMGLLIENMTTPSMDYGQ